MIDSIIEYLEKSDKKVNFFNMKLSARSLDRKISDLLNAQNEILERMQNIIDKLNKKMPVQ